ncbi:hypothetical protein Zm00014a_025068 [Zea mays]|uniref:Uncharacterized protein n=1 Tax=Zea mays TaxID=4577 RepID=A0A3L6ECW0_MAIZE|nr:hypothetical protein Zm00014a_025068 [Zea mays]
MCKIVNYKFVKL